MGGAVMAQATTAQMLEIQEACDDLFCDPDDVSASMRIRQVLGGSQGSPGSVVGTAVSRQEWRRLVKIACDELHDDPTDLDARNRLLVLVAAGDGDGSGIRLPAPAA